MAEENVVQEKPPRFLRVTKFCELSGMKKSATYAALARKEIPSVRIHGTILIPVAALEALEARALSGE